MVEEEEGEDKAEIIFNK